MAIRKLQADCPELATRVEFGVYLAFARVHSLLYQRLSLNISREVFSYIGLDPILLLGAFRGNKLVLYDLTTESCKETIPNIALNLSGTGLVMLSDRQMLVVGGSSSRCVKSVDVLTGVITEEAAMKECRAWPGVLLYNARVWVFGGNTEPALDSVEWFLCGPRTWQQGRSMHSPKVCFTPCAHQGRIYLPCVSAQKQALEVLEPISEVYTLLPLRLCSGQFGSVSFIENNHLYVIDYHLKAGIWALGSQNTELRALQITVNGAKNCFTNGSPVKCRNSVYWLDGRFILAKFDLKTQTLARCETIEAKPPSSS